MTTTIVTITLSVIAIIVLIADINVRRAYFRPWEELLDDAHEELHDWSRAAGTEDAVYTIRQFDNGTVSVVRNVTLDRSKHFGMCIKSFKDEDRDFNIREAEELIEMLQS